MSEISPMLQKLKESISSLDKTPEENLRDIMRNFTLLNRSIDLFIKSWAENEDIRNRPNRQKLSGELCNVLIHPIKFGDLILKIEKETGINLD